MQIRRETLGAKVYDSLRDRLLRGEFPEGARLVQSPLSEEMGVSRIPVRDALKRLENEGLVVGDEIGRYTVVPFSAQDADEIYAIRRRLEPFAAERAAQAITAEALSDVKTLFEDLSKAARRRQLQRYTELNVKFHMTIYEASGMRRLVRIIRGLWLGVPPLTPIVLEGRISRSQKEHEEIVSRLAARDGTGAARALDRHIENAADELRDTMAKNWATKRHKTKRGEKRQADKGSNDGQVSD
jgi:DNA-binding GntR family transcriptional regulator